MGTQNSRTYRDICRHMHRYTHTYLQTYRKIQRHAHTHTHAKTHTETCAHVHIYSNRLPMHSYTNTPSPTQTYSSTYNPRYVCTHISFPYTKIHAQSCRHCYRTDQKFTCTPMKTCAHSYAYPHRNIYTYSHTYLYRYTQTIIDYHRYTHTH